MTHEDTPSAAVTSAGFAGVIVAGGRASRLGQPKATALVGGELLLARALEAVAGMPVVVVGGPELDAVIGGRPAAARVRETPPFSGPAAAIGAGCAELDRRGWASEWLVLLACDLPFASAAVEVLLAAIPSLAPDEDGVCFRIDGRPQWLCGVYRRAVVRAGLDVVDGSTGLVSAPVRALFTDARLRLLDDPGDLAFDIDTPDDLHTADERLADHP